MLSESLSALCRITAVLLEEDGYLLARVDAKGSPYIAEVAPKSEDPSRTRIWPAVPGILRPSHDNRERSGVRILLFRDSGGQLLSERISNGTLAEEAARALAVSLAGTLRSLHTRGFVMGYIGPETIYTGPDDTPLLIAGARGIPRSPFAAPEALAGSLVDPRTDIFALGTLMFRAVAGSDDRDIQLEAWNHLSPRFSGLVERMVAEKPENRHSSIAALVQDLASPAATPPPVRPGRSPKPDSPVAGQGPPAEPPRRTGRSRGWVPFAAVAALALAAALFVLFSPGRGTGPPDTAVTDSLPVAPDTSVLPPGDPVPPDTLSLPSFAGPSETVVWISNCTGTAGAASEFRSGPAREFARVYPSTGAGVRNTSLLLLRRSDTGRPISEQYHWQMAQALCSSDTNLSIRPVDMTVLLGEDLSYPGLVPEVLSDSSTASDTIYVEVVNQGLQYALEGSGPASWFAAALEGKSVDLGGTEYVISIADIRDGDREPGEEIGVPALLDSTIFLYRSDSGLMPELEGKLRSYVQALPDEVSGPPQGVPVPDIWVLLGGREGSQ
jgi:hypothetical protein